MHVNSQILKRIRLLLGLFIFGLVVSGLTAFPLETELKLLVGYMNPNTGVGQWISKVYEALKHTNEQYPFIAYGTDWLAFAHLVIAIVFIGPMKDPVKNIWVIQFGIIACVTVIPLALIAGHIREIPFYWRLIDCSFGIVGAIPLLLCLQLTKKLEQPQTTTER